MTMQSAEAANRSTNSMQFVGVPASSECFLIVNRRPGVGNNRLLLCAVLQPTIGSFRISQLSC